MKKSIDSTKPEKSRSESTKAPKETLGLEEQADKVQPLGNSREEMLTHLRKIYPGVPDEQLIEESNGLI